METQTYCFFGSECEIGRRTPGERQPPLRHLEKFGTQVKLTDGEALNALEGGAALCPVADFHFTPEEIKGYLYPKMRMNAPKDFKERVKAATVATAALRRKLQTSAFLDAVQAAKPGDLDSSATPARDGLRYKTAFTLSAAEHPPVAAYLADLQKREALEKQQRELEAQAAALKEAEAEQQETPDGIL